MIKFKDKRNLVIDNQVSIKPEYLFHPYVSGNKYRKLKYNLAEAARTHKNTLLTFGGAYSNHIAAVASAGHEYGFRTVGIIRGEELESRMDANPTLSYAKEMGMTLKFVSRHQYRQKSDPHFISNLHAEFDDAYIIPEGGTNTLAVKGCEEIIQPTDEIYDFICCAVGTGGTIAGLINSAFPNQKILGFPALKGDFLQEEISKFATAKNWELIPDYHFGGYAKVTDELVSFINRFKTETHIPLDPIYTGKMMFGIYDMLAKGYFPENAKLLVIHTGGLQGITGMNQKLKQQNRSVIV